MAMYTIELRNLLPHYKLFDFPYPIYDESKRRDFEQAFERHFYFREICCPEPDRFLWYLHDKMVTVFPYYNELMRTATIEYDIENPYNLTETYTRKTDSTGKSNAASHSVGLSDDERTTDTTDQRTNTGNGKTTNTGTHSETDKTVTETDGTENVGTAEEHTGKSVKKFLDTPQGKLNLDETDYLTNLTQDETNGSSEGSTDRDTHSTTETTRNVNGGSDQQQISETADTSEGKGNTTEKGEQRTRSDNNTRAESVANSVEEYVMQRKGNIGVNPASYEIDQHIKTQKTLQNIYRMFFDECEDLFMQVF